MTARLTKFPCRRACLFALRLIADEAARDAQPFASDPHAYAQSDVLNTDGHSSNGAISPTFDSAGCTSLLLLCSLACSLVYASLA
eukprot:1611992-Pleurochrysis_carterae.AAC.1